MRAIIYERPDGGIAIVHPALNRNDPPGWTEADSEKRAFHALPPTALNPRFVEASEIPEDRYFRNAWKQDFTVDVHKAKELTKERLRQERGPLLEANDIKLQNAIADGDEKAKEEAIAERDRLRDITKQVDGVEDLEALKVLKASKDNAKG